MPEWKWARNGERPPGQDPAVIGEWLDGVRSKRGVLTDEVIATEAERDPEDPTIGPWFTWDSGDAVRALHVIEAGRMRRSVVLVQITPTQVQPVPAFVSVVVRGRHQFQRTDLVVAEGDAEKVQRLVAEARQQIDGMTQRLNSILELVSLVATTRQATRRLAGSRTVHRGTAGKRKVAR